MVRYAYHRLGILVLGEKTFAAKAMKIHCVPSNPQSSNQTRWKQTFYTKNVHMDLTFAMMIKKVEIVYVGVQRGNIQGFGGLAVQPLFCHSAHAKLVGVGDQPQKLGEKVQ